MMSTIVNKAVKITAKVNKKKKVNCRTISEVDFLTIFTRFGFVAFLKNIK